MNFGIFILSYGWLFILSLFIFYIKLLKIKPNFFDVLAVLILGSISYLNPYNFFDNIINLAVLSIYIIIRFKTGYNKIILTTLLAFNSMVLFDSSFKLFTNNFIVPAEAALAIYSISLIYSLLLPILANKVFDFNAIPTDSENPLFLLSYLIFTFMIYWLSSKVSMPHLLTSAVFLLTMALFMLARYKLSFVNSEWENALTEMASVKELNLKIRSQKHDFNNHLQVISALIQAKKFDSCYDYILNLNKHGFSVDNINTGTLAINALLAAKHHTAQTEGVTFEYNIWDNLGGDFNMQSWEITSVLGNLLDNALHEEKKSEKKQKLIRFSLKKDGNFFEFLVNNLGSYIDDTLINKIFEPGFSTKGCSNRGMGLHIIKDIVERHDGHMKVESTPDKGTTFLLYLPEYIPKAHFGDVTE